MKKKIKWFVFGFLALLILIQFIQINKTNPPLDPAADIFAHLDAGDAFIAKVRDACYDCHSNEVEYPWYTNVQPVGWWIKKHINEGTKHLNFSEFGNYEAKRAHHKLEECYEMVEKGEMPLNSFTWVHSEAKLTDLEREEMVKWFKEAMASY